MRILCKHLFVLAVIICCIAGIAISAQAEEIIVSGTCGSNLRWSLDDTGTLTISGTGAMVNYTSASNVPWYTYRKSISSIIISDGITSIGDSAFEQCSSRSITIPKSVTSIGAWAFSESSLQSITIPDGVTSIGMHAFARCPYLKSITIPNGVTKISNCAFYKSGIQSITIPNSVTSIGVFAFSESSLTSIIIPNSVTNIEVTAFFNCCSLRKVTYCGTEEQWRQLNLDSANAPLTAATRIYHNWNISSCTELKSCTICGESTIGHAWLGATCDKPETCSLCGVTEGDICHNVHLGICENCQQYGTCGENLIWTLNAVGTLTILGTGEMTDYGWIDEVADWIEPPWQAVATDIKAVVIEKGVTTIGCEAFYNLSNLTSVTIGDSVTSIGSNAFYDCANLTSITIGNSVSSIGGSAFYGCSSLTSIDIPDSVTRIGSDAFGCCRSLQSITIPNSITSISYGTFQGCSDLTIITIPDSVTYIGDNAFGLCSGLTGITIPNSITSIGYMAFRGCSSLNHIAYTGTQSQWDSISIGPDNPYLTNAILHYETRFRNVDNCVETGVYCPICKEYLVFEPYENGEHNYGDWVVTTPPTVTTVGEKEKICSICGDRVTETIPYTGNFIATGTCGDNLTWTLDDEGTLTISGTGAIDPYYGDDSWAPHRLSITSIVISDTVTGIGDYAFQHLGGLTSVSIGNNVTSIGYRAFLYCVGLTSVTIPNSVTHIGESAFEGCNDLTSITIPDSITNIAECVFSGCSSLTSVTIPDSVTSIGSCAFYQCSSLTSVRIPDSVTSIGNSAFSRCSNLQSITIGNGVTSTGIMAFAFCSNLTQITIPDNIVHIGNNAFLYCGLESITLPDSVTTIGSYAFCNCSKLTNITIPDSVTYIDEGAFGDCSNLNHIAYAGTESQWNEITIGSENTSFTNATLHYETRFLNRDNCVGTGVYCPVCEEYLTYKAYENGEHSYGDWVVTTPPTVTTEGEKEKICSVCGDRVTETIPMLAYGISQWSITLADDIGATFYLKVENDDLDNTFVTVTVDGVQKQYNLRDLETANGQYILNVNVAAAQMNDDIIIQVLSDDAVIREMKYTIRQYAEYILNGNYSENTKYLVQAMLNYGASAQIFFKHNTTNLANNGYEMTNVPEIPEASTNSASIGKVDGISYYGASLNHEAKISVRFYFTVTGNIKDYTFSDAQGNTYRAIPRKGMYYIEILNINPADYDEVIKIIVHDGSSIMMVDYSPLRYISRKYYGSDDANLVNMVAALYRYHKAAEAYLDSL